MPKRLDGLNNTRHESYIDFMRALSDVGFDNELDNARIIKTLSEKVDEIWKRVDRKGSYYITCALRPHAVHTSELVVTMHSTESADVKVDVILFVRPERDSLAIGRDVIGEEFTPTAGDVPFTGMLVDREHGTNVIVANRRFDKQALAVFQGTYSSLQMINPNDNVLARMTPTATGMDIKFTVVGKKIARILLEYSV